MLKNIYGDTIDDGKNSRLIEFLYDNEYGAKLLPVLIKPWITRASESILDCRLSKLLINPFIKLNNIDMSQYEHKDFTSYNDFFIRRLKPGVRSLPSDRTCLFAPCDSKLTVHEITQTGRFPIKGINYTVEELTQSKRLCEKMAGGYMMVFRLSVDDYHRYVYIDDGIKTQNYRIKGHYHTVNPFAASKKPIYKENERVISLLKSKHFGTVAMIEVGAMMVGKIVNYHGEGQVKRGDEKGRFEFGGSTCILMFQPDTIKVENQILLNSKLGYETKVKLGQSIGHAI